MNNKESKITIRIDEDDKEMLKEIAEQKDIPMSQIIRKLIKDYIQEEQTTK